MADEGIAAQVQAAIWLAKTFDLEVETFGRAAFARKDTCKLETTGRFLAYDVTLDGGWIFVSVQLMDSGDPPESLLHVAAELIHQRLVADAAEGDVGLHYPGWKG